MSGVALDRRDFRTAAALGLGYVLALASTTKSLGYARDEGFYVYCARVLEGWFDVFSTNGLGALARANIDRAFEPVHEHPGLMKLLFAASHRFLYERWSLFSEPGLAYRFPGMLMGGLAVAVLCLWGKETMGRAGGTVAALSFACMPRVFFHAHLACLDVPVAAMWLVTSFVYVRAFASGRWVPVLGAGIAYGLLLDTKHNGWLFPFVLGAHLVLVALFERRHAVPRQRPRVPWALLSVLLVGPLVLFIAWPWLWFDTSERLLAWFKFHLGHEYYNMEFLGRTYWKPPMPRLYAWVMTLATVPLVTLALFGVGLVDASKNAWRGSEPKRFASEAFWLVSLLVSYAPWWSRDTPIFGGTKHWITAYPFLCLFAGRGFVLATSRLRALLPERLRRPELVSGALGVATLLGPAAMAWHSHPYGLTFYTPLVGGAPGAASLGLNRTFWGYTTGVLTGEINERAPESASIYVHDTALQSWELLRADGRIRADLSGTLAIPASKLALYHHEPHMRRVEFETWVAYGTVAPVAMGTYDGVPVVWLYERPEDARHSE